jgi:hypothetical protein
MYSTLEVKFMHRIELFNNPQKFEAKEKILET